MITFRDNSGLVTFNNSFAQWHGFDTVDVNIKNHTLPIYLYLAMFFISYIFIFNAFDDIIRQQNDRNRDALLKTYKNK